MSTQGPDLAIEATGLRSLTRPSSLRLLAELAISGLALLTGVLTARNLGPAGKGDLSTLNYLVALAWPLAALGAGEVSVNLLGRRRVELRTALGTTITLILVTSAIYGPLIYLVTQSDVLGLRELHGGRLAAMVAVPAASYAGVLPLIAEHRSLFGWTSVARVLGALTTLVATFLLVTQLHLSIFGGMLAVALGPLTVTAVVAFALLRDGASLRPRWDGSFARQVVRKGAPVQLGSIVAAGAARADVLMVAALGTSSEVGLYSVALTAAQVAILPAVAVSAASFPRIAALEAAAAARLTATTLRAGVLATAVVAVALGLAAPWGLPLIFGTGFRGAVAPVEILLVANVLGAVQWCATRAAVARGNTKAIVQSFGVTMVIMLALDVALIPRWGPRGAGVAATIATGAGAGVALLAMRTAGLSREGS